MQASVTSRSSGFTIEALMSTSQHKQAATSESSSTPVSFTQRGRSPVKRSSPDITPKSDERHTRAAFMPPLAPSEQSMQVRAGALKGAKQLDKMDYRWPSMAPSRPALPDFSSLTLPPPASHQWPGLADMQQQTYNSRHCLNKTFAGSSTNCVPAYSPPQPTRREVEAGQLGGMRAATHAADVLAAMYMAPSYNPAPSAEPGYAWLLSQYGSYVGSRTALTGVDSYLGLFPFRKQKRVRTAFAPSQLLELERAFHSNHYVVGQERKELALSLNLSETQVKVWFQNRRTKQKRVRQEDVDRRQRFGSSNGDNRQQSSNEDDLDDTYDSDLDIDIHTSRSSTPNSLEISSSSTALDIRNTATT